MEQTVILITERKKYKYKNQKKVKEQGCKFLQTYKC